MPKQDEKEIFSMEEVANEEYLYEDEEFEFNEKQTTLARLGPGLKITILLLICFCAIFVRVFSVIRFESIIHEFDPWFNYRVTEYLVNEGYYRFRYWNDMEVWYPLGRYTGATLYPGLMMTAAAGHYLLNKVLMIPIHIREVCVFTAPVVAAFTAIATYLLTKEISGKSGAGLIAALLVSLIPTYMSRSVAGSYDNEAVAIFAMVFAFYTYAKVIRTGGLFDAVVAGLAYYYMVLTWGGYVFVNGYMSVYTIILTMVGRLDIKAYTAFSCIYLMGNLYSLNLPFVGPYAVWRSSEHLASHAAFALIQIYGINKILKKFLSEKSYKIMAWTIIQGAAVSVIGAILYIVMMGKATAGHRIIALLHPIYAKKSNPLTQSISEHRSTPWGQMFGDIHYSYVFAPLGALILFARPNNSKIFGSLLCVMGLYFASIMVRLCLVAGPICCTLAGVGFSTGLQWAAISLKVATTKVGQIIRLMKPRFLRKAPVPWEVGIAIILMVFWVCSRAIYHGSHTCAESLSWPAVIGSYNNHYGHRVIMDDIREGYYWIRQNTKSNARILSWWDYGYQLAGFANRTTIVDNNTWNRTHIGLAGLILSANEEVAYQRCLELDIDYVLVYYAGVRDMAGDDIGKFLWFVRLASAEFPDKLKEEEYYSPWGNGFVISQNVASRRFVDSLTYRIAFNRLRDLNNFGKGLGWDQARSTHIGLKDLSMKHFEEAYTTNSWVIRIFKVKKPQNTEDINFSTMQNEADIRYFSRLPVSWESSNSHSTTSYYYKNTLES